MTREDDKDDDDNNNNNNIVVVVVMVHRQQNSANPSCMGPDRPGIIRWYLHWPKYLQGTLCSCSSTWAIQLMRRVCHLNISVVCSGHQRPVLCFPRFSELKKLMEYETKCLAMP